MSDLHNTSKPVEATSVAELPNVASTPAMEPEVSTTEAPVLKGEAAAATETTTASDTTSPAAPVTLGALGYKAPGLIKSFKFSKRYFWLGDEAVPVQHLSQYLRGEKPEAAHPTAAWSSQTGKGLLYYVKHESEKAHPTGVLNLAEASDLEREAHYEFSFKLHGHKHKFMAADDVVRDGWYMSIETAMQEAKATKEGILNSEGYKESIAHLGEPAALAGGVAGGAAGIKAHEHKTRKSTDLANNEGALRNGSSSSSSDDARVAAKKDKKSKSRSLSRGAKRNSIFGSILGKKDEHDAKKEVKKEEFFDAKEDNTVLSTEVEEPAVAAAPLDAAAIADRVIIAPVEAIEPAVASETVATADAAAGSPKDAPVRPNKRASIFESFYNKVRSPAHEKKETDIVPIVPANDAAIATEAPLLSEPAVEATEAPLAAEEPVAPMMETTAPRNERKGSFLGGLMSKARALSPAAEKRSRASTDGTVIAHKEEEAIVEPQVDEAVAPTAAETDVTPVNSSAKVAAPTNGRRRSFFGSLGAAKKEKVDDETVQGDTTATPKNETPLGKITNLFRKPSAAVRTRDSKKENVETEKAVEAPTSETAQPETFANIEAPVSALKPFESEKSEAMIGDVGAESITLGHHEAMPTVSAAA